MSMAGEHVILNQAVTLADSGKVQISSAATESAKFRALIASPVVRRASSNELRWRFFLAETTNLRAVWRFGSFREKRELIAELTVLDNLRLGAYLRRDRGVAADLADVFARFPRLRERRGQTAGALSGGERQMLALSCFRCLAGSVPR
jgi:ABC-type multidrug transport system ATPase subunit